jgi:hypothetical protein
MALLALTSGPTDLGTARTLIRLEPSETNRTLWRDAVLGSVRDLSVANVLAADDLLQRAAAVTPELRAEVFASVGVDVRETASGEQQLELVRRQATVLLELAQAAAAHERLQEFCGDRDVPSLRTLRMEAALRAGAFEAAGRVDSQPVAWVDILEQLVGQDPQAAAAVRDEIVRRFGNELNGPLRDRLDAAGSAITPPTVTESPS